MSDTIPALPTSPSIEEIVELKPYYHDWFRRFLEWMIERYESDPAYPFLDTKFDVIEGESFHDDDMVRGRRCVYGWIQGRGLESLAYHAEWLRRNHDSGPGNLIDRLNAVIAELHDILRDVRRRNGARISFLMDRDGNPKNPHSDESSDINPYTFADLFCAKGFVAAARYRCDPEKVEESHQYIEEIGTTILNHSFRSGQIDPRNPTATTESPEVRQHGPGMIYLGALALVAGKSAQGWVQRTGIALMSHIFDAHVAADDAIPPLLPNDLWEAVTRDDTPYIDRGMIVSDPGHSIEFVGLASRYLRLFADSFPADKRELVESMTLRLPEILFRNFDNGFRREVGGITKTIDLITQKPVDANLPWWSLPESMRSAMEVHRFAGSDRKRSRCREIFAQAHNAFVSHYVRRGDDRVPDLWYQSRNAKGLVVDVIPACPDIDPGYHTNMSILEALELAETEIL